MAEKRLEKLIDEEMSQKEVLSMKGDIGTTKYLIRAKIEASGVVERPDVVGAIFGQTEGLLGEGLDLRALQKMSRIGRIEVNIKSSQGKSTGNIIIPSSLDRVKTSIIAAALETIDRVGPCEATIKTEKIQDIRDSKRRFIVDRAKEILENFGGAGPESVQISELVKGITKPEEIGSYEGLPAGPAVEESDAIIIVEGRADVLNLLQCGIKNTVAIEGTSVPKSVAELSQNKTVTAFLDGDRGGDLILKELLQVAKLNYVARAPEGKVVEELSRSEIIEALKNKVPADRATAVLKGKKMEPSRAPEENNLKTLESIASRLRGTLKAQLLNEKLERIDEIQVRDLTTKLQEAENVAAVVFDGIVTQKLADIAAEKGLRYLVGVRERVERKPREVLILTLNELRKLP
jgi:DNA primase